MCQQVERREDRFFREAGGSRELRDIAGTRELRDEKRRLRAAEGHARQGQGGLERKTAGERAQQRETGQSVASPGVGAAGTETAGGRKGHAPEEGRRAQGDRPAEEEPLVQSEKKGVELPHGRVAALLGGSGGELLFGGPPFEQALDGPAGRVEKIQRAPGGLERCRREPTATFDQGKLVGHGKDQPWDDRASRTLFRRSASGSSR